MNQLKKGAILSYLNIILTNVVGLVLTPFIIRSLGDSEYGLYTLIGAFVGYLSIMDLGLNNTIVRYVSKYRAEKNKKGEEEFLGTSFLIYSIISLLVMLLGGILFLNIETVFGMTMTPEQLEKAKWMVILLIFNLMFSLPGGAFTAICNAYEHFVFPRLINIIKYVIRSFLIVIILYYGSDSVGLVLLDTVINLLIIAVTFYYVKKKLQVSYNFKRKNNHLVYEIFSYSIWIFVYAITVELQWRGGQFVIGTNLDTSQVAIYAIGAMLGSYYGAFSGAISNLFLPKATQMVVGKASSMELTMMMVRIARFSLFPLMIVFIGFVFLGKEFIIIWVGDSFLEAYYIAIIIMFGYTIPLIQTFANSLLEARKLFRLKALVYLFCFILGILISFFFVNKYQGIGVIVCIVSSWIVGQIIMNILYINQLKLNILFFFKELYKGLFLVFLLMLIVAYGISKINVTEGWIELILKSILLLGVYTLILYFIGMNSEEKSKMNFIKDRLKK